MGKAISSICAAVCVSAFSVCAADPASAQEPKLQGAAKFIAECNAVASSSRAAGDANSQANAALKAKIAKFMETKDSLSAQDAAAAWLALYGDLCKLNASWRWGSGLSGMPMRFEELAEALPPSRDWTELSEKAKAQQKPQSKLRSVFKALAPSSEKDNEQGLKLFLAAINGDAAALQAGLKAAKGSASNAKMLLELQFMEDFALALADPSTASGLDYERMSRLLAALRKSPPSSLFEVSLPEFDKSVSDAEIASLAAGFLSCAHASLKAKPGARSAQIAKAEAFKLGAKLKAPQWSLVDQSPEGLAICLASVKLFPPKDNPKRGNSGYDNEAFGPYEARRLVDIYFSRDDRTEALMRCVAGLASQGRVEEAVALIPSYLDDLRGRDYEYYSDSWDRLAPSYEGLLSLQEAFERSLEKDAFNVELWKALFDVSSASGHAKDFAERSAKALEAKSAPPLSALKLRLLHARALLSLDQVEPAISELRAVASSASSGIARCDMDKAFALRLEAAEALANAGNGLRDKALVLEAFAAAMGLKDAKTAFDSSKGEDQGYDRGFNLNGIKNALFEAKLYAEYEAFLFADAKDGLGKLSKRDMSAQDINSELEGLASLYFEAGRFEDVLKLLDECPWWNFSDIKDGHYWSDGRRLPCIAAASLAKAGRAKEAIALLKYALLMDLGRDADYELFCELQGQEAIPFLESLSKIDRFETRPLIWRAVLLFNAGKLEEAEALARAAISIDPTDGKAMSGSRLKAYETLSAILSKEGKGKEADLFATVVKSVRIAEEGDRLSIAGLHARALKLYREADAVFSDAYCIHWRLAKRLLDAGDAEGASSHFKIAFELMPGQFGRVASFCFGCEGAFSNPASRSAAEDVLLKLAAAKPECPQVHFLIGELRESQSRLGEAAAAYKKAFELDPEYLDACQKFYDIADDAGIPLAERNAIAMKAISLDPALRHFRLDLRSYCDFKAFARKIEEGRASFPPVPREAYVLKAAKARLKAAPDLFWSSYGGGSDISKGPAALLDDATELKPFMEMARPGSF